MTVACIDNLKLLSKFECIPVQTPTTSTTPTGKEQSNNSSLHSILLNAMAASLETCSNPLCDSEQLKKKKKKKTE